MKQVGVVAQPLPEQSCGFHAVAIVGIALLDRATRQAMKTKQKPLWLAMYSPVFTHVPGQRLYVPRIIVVTLYEAYLGFFSHLGVLTLYAIPSLCCFAFSLFFLF